MYARYQYLAGAMASDILDDVVTILTGETLVANLSASCNKGFSSIESVVPAGWTLHDGAAGANVKVIKAPLADDATRFKFVEVNTNTAGSVLTKVFEEFNATTHAWTNLCYASDLVSSNQRVSTNTVGTLHIFSSARFLLLAGMYNGLWGSPTNAGPSGCFERTRPCGWDTLAAGWPPFLFLNLGDLAATSNGLSAYAPRYMDRARNTLTGSSAPLYGFTGPFGSDGSNSQLSIFKLFSQLSGIDQRVPDESGGFVTPFFPISFLNYATMPEPYGEISSLCDLWALPQGVAANLDVLQQGGLDFICLQAASPSKIFIIRKG
ncbi:MAG: hypothetical protein HQM03_21100 [Magnetococcales bacterium]|nr:hypothetical protein [Magnetococcales bacterium]